MAPKTSGRPDCPCGGGQSCIVARRRVGDWVHKDQVFQKVGLPVRRNCWQPHTRAAMEASIPAGH